VSIVTKLLIAIIAIIGLPSIIITAIVYQAMVTQFQQSIGEHLLDNVAHAANTIDTFIDQRVKDIDAFSDSPIFTIGNNAEVTQHLQSIIAVYDVYDLLTYTDLDGEVLSSTQTNTIGKNLLELEPDIRASFQETLQGGVDDVFVSDLSDSEHSEISHTLRQEDLDLEVLSDVVSQNGEKLGVLIGRVNISTIIKTVHQLDEHTIGDEYAYLVDRTGKVLISLDPNSETLQSHRDAKIKNLSAKLASDEDGYLIYNTADQRKVMSAYADLNEFGSDLAGDWSLFTIAPYSEIMAPIYRLIYQLIAIVLFIILTMVFIGYKLSRTLISDRITKLSQAASSLTRGQLNIDLTGTEGEDEIGQLGKGFHAMANTSKDVLAQANAIALGDFKTHIKIRSDEDELGRALQNMTTTLQTYKTTNEQQNWLKTGQTQFSLAIQGVLALDTLSNNLLQYINEYLDLKMAIFYIVKDDALHYLNSLSCASDSNKARHYNFGEGTVGQCAKDQDIIHLTSIPTDIQHDHQLSLSSVLQEIRATSVFLMPLIYNQKTLGVLELGSSTPFSQNQIDLVTSLAGPIATSINIINSNQVTRTLFEESKAKSDHLEEQQVKLKASEEKALSSTQSKSEFLASMSHEIRTPLNGVLGMTELILDTPLNNEQKNYIHTIQQSGRVLTTVINDILDFSKMEAGALELDEQTFNVEQLIMQATSAFRLSKKEMVAFNVEISPDISPYLYGDTTRINQIIGNLLNNAFKFTQTGHITLKASSHLDEKSEILKISIEDSGIGISKSKQADLFKPFQQADQSTSRRFGGTGLGLTICQRLIKLMQGDISVYSDGQTGSTFNFHITLKVARKPHLEAQDAHAAVSKKEFVGLKVLLVEDNTTNQLVATTILKKKKVQVRLAENGEEAIEAIKRERFDIVFMDCEMPIKDGYTATQEIRQWEEEQQLDATNICALTAHVLQEHVSRCYVSGMNDHITKPISIDKLDRVLEAANNKISSKLPLKR